MFIDERASDAQFDALVAAFTGELGGPLGDLAELVGERVAIERAPISHEIKAREGSPSATASRRRPSPTGDRTDRSRR